MRKFVSAVSLLGLAGGLFVLAAGAAMTAETFVPKGHTYGPDAEVIPPSQSREYEIQSQADVRETEIWRSQLEQRRWLEEMRLDRNLLTTRRHSGFGVTDF